MLTGTHKIGAAEKQVVACFFGLHYCELCEWGERKKGGGGWKWRFLILQVILSILILPLRIHDFTHYTFIFSFHSLNQCNSFSVSIMVMVMWGMKSYILLQFILFLKQILIFLLLICLCLIHRKLRGRQRWKLELQPLMHPWMNGSRFVLSCIITVGVILLSVILVNCNFVI